MARDAAETGSADLVATILTLPQLPAEWPHLELSDMLRAAWEQTYLALSDDITWVGDRRRVLGGGPAGTHFGWAFGPLKEMVAKARLPGGSDPPLAHARARLIEPIKSQRDTREQAMGEIHVPMRSRHDGGPAGEAGKRAAKAGGG